jgi:hypothetical protein
VRPLEDKLGPKYNGPYEIVKKHGKNYVTLALEDGTEMKVHIERIKVYKKREREDEELVEDDKIIKSDEAKESDWEDPDKDKLLPNDLIGKRVRVYWSGDKAWYDGLVTARKKKQHVVKYDDGEVKAERLLGYASKTGPPWKLLVKGDVGRRGSNAISFKEGSVTWQDVRERMTTEECGSFFKPRK